MQAGPALRPDLFAKPARRLRFTIFHNFAMDSVHFNDLSPGVAIIALSGIPLMYAIVTLTLTHSCYTLKVFLRLTEIVVLVLPSVPVTGQLIKNRRGVRLQNVRNNKHFCTQARTQLQYKKISLFQFNNFNVILFRIRVPEINQMPIGPIQLVFFPALLFLFNNILPNVIWLLKRFGFDPDAFSQW